MLNNRNLYQNILSSEVCCAVCSHHERHFPDILKQIWRAGEGKEGEGGIFKGEGIRISAVAITPSRSIFSMNT